MSAESACKGWRVQSVARWCRTVRAAGVRLIVVCMCWDAGMGAVAGFIMRESGTESWPGSLGRNNITSLSHSLRLRHQPPPSAIRAPPLSNPHFQPCLARQPHPPVRPPTAPRPLDAPTRRPRPACQAQLARLPRGASKPAPEPAAPHPPAAPARQPLHDRQPRHAGQPRPDRQLLIAARRTHPPGAPARHPHHDRQACLTRQPPPLPTAPGRQPAAPPAAPAGDVGEGAATLGGVLQPRGG